MSSVPFYRRIFFGVFIVAFAVLAPAVVFYTAGYRWNAKKGVIERNGTLIIDSLPAGASISLNGVLLSDKTPITLQNVAPGTYQIRLERPGYSRWEKMLQVRPELVTFVNDVRLWRAADPTLLHEGDARVATVSPNGRYLASIVGEMSEARLTFEDIPGASVGVFTPSEPVTSAFRGGAPTGTVQLIWNQASSAVLIRDSLLHFWIGDRSGRTVGAERLPDGAYRWSGDVLVGVDGREQIAYSIANGATNRSTLAANVIDEDDVYRLMTTTGTTRLSVTERGRGGRRFELPSGSWLFAGRIEGRIFLTDGRNWIGFNPAGTEPGLVTLPADELPMSRRRTRDTVLLARGGGELWLDVLGHDPELLLRTSEPLVGMGWDASGNNVFYATRKTVSAMGLDVRGGRLTTPLASFENIHSFSAVGNRVFIVGARDGRQGIWTMDLE